MTARRRRVLPFLGLLLALALGGCQTVTETGRSRILLVSPAEEAAMGLTAFEEIKQREKVSSDPRANERVRRVGLRIRAAVGADLPGAAWEFVVFESPQANAFALPGGKVGVYSGLLALAESDDELAVVVGHEIAHVTARHGAERMSQALAAAVGGAVVGVATEDSRNRDLWRIGYGVGATLGTLAYSRVHESEADFIGLKYAARAGYDPRAAVTFWRKMAAAARGPRPPKWLSTHPPEEDRIARLEGWIPALLPVYESARPRH